MFYTRNSQLFMLLPVQFAENQMESAEISAEIAADTPKDAVLRKPYEVVSPKSVDVTKCANFHRGERRDR